MKSVPFLAIALRAMPPLAAQRAPNPRALQAAPGALAMSDEVVAKLTVDRLVQQVAALQAERAALKAQQATTASEAAADTAALAVLRREFDSHDHFWLHPEQSSKTTYYTPVLTSVRRKFCHVESANNPAATASKMVVCSLPASAE